MANLTRGIPLSKISPKFLHSNATSHTWPFSAVAELIDNAYDPDVAASELLIDKCVIHGKVCLVFQDDGAGMNFENLLKMLSFGYCDKEAFENSANYLPIGHYGNGFKSGSMRLGEDAVVFTACKTTASVGFLSQTYLESIGADCVYVPMVEYRLPHLERFKSQESRNNLEAVLTHSPFHTEEDLKVELKTIMNTRTSTGTKIVLYNLRRHQDGKLELDFESDSADIRNPEAHEVDLTSVYHRTSHLESSEYLRSLREYCSILYLRPRMKIYIRGVKVKTQLISKCLSGTEIDIYKPTWLNKPLRITFGFSTKIPLKEDYGVMFYNRNRLIKAYEKLGYQKQPNDMGTGVVGVVQVDFLKPIHNKQDFEKDEKYNTIMSAIGLKLNDYWNEKRNGGSGGAKNSKSSQLPDWLWVQCERCLKWRRLPDSPLKPDLPDQWFCHMNPDPIHNRCDIPEEPEDEDEAVKRPTYEKTFKKKQEERKRQKQAAIAAKEAELKAREALLVEAQRQQQNEVSSSQQSQRDIANLQRALLEAKKREENHKRLIVKIQNQKRQIENQHNSLIVAAHNLNTATTTATEIMDVATALTDDSPVSSTSGKRAVKRRRSSSSSGSGCKKIMNITTDQGDVMTIERADTDEEEEQATIVDGDEDDCDPAVVSSVGAEEMSVSSVLETPTPAPLSLSTSTPKTGKRQQARKALVKQVGNVIDLTLEDEEDTSRMEVNTTTADVKPDVKELDQQNGAGENERIEENTVETASSQHNKTKVKQEDDSKYNHLRHKYRLLTQRFHNLQRNVHKLLSFIVPDVDLGSEDDIEHIVTEMIRVNCNQTQESS